MLKPTLCLGHYTRKPTPDANKWDGYELIRVRSQIDYIDALNMAWSHNRKTVIAFDKEGLVLDAPMIKGKTHAEHIVQWGAAGEMSATLRGDKWRILGLYSSNNHTLANVVLDGMGGTSAKGVVCGTSKQGQDRHEGPAKNIELDHVLVKEVGEQAFIWGHSSVGLKLRDVDLIDTGIGPTKSKYCEGFYFGNGGSSGLRPQLVDIEGFYVARTGSSEAADMKVNATGLRMRWFEFEDITANYSAALTLCIDPTDGGHGQDNDIDIADGHIHKVHSGDHGVAGIQAGTGAKLSRIIIDQIDKSDGIQTAAHAHGPNKVLELEDVLIGRVGPGRVPVRENVSWLKENVRRPMSIRQSNVVHTGRAVNGADAAAVWGAKTGSSLPKPPIVVAKPTPTPPPVPPTPPADPQPVAVTTKTEKTIKINVNIDYDTTVLDATIAAMTRFSNELKQIGKRP